MKCYFTFMSGVSVSLKLILNGSILPFCSFSVLGRESWLSIKLHHRGKEGKLRATWKQEVWWKRGTRRGLSWGYASRVLSVLRGLSTLLFKSECTWCLHVCMHLFVFFKSCVCVCAFVFVFVFSLRVCRWPRAKAGRWGTTSLTRSLTARPTSWFSLSRHLFLLCAPLAFTSVYSRVLLRANRSFTDMIIVANTILKQRSSLHHHNSRFIRSFVLIIID